MKKAIRKLRLREGDIIVVRTPEDMEALMRTPLNGMKMPNCPIVVARESIHRLSKKYLAKLLAETAA
jgi:hypothetical protein